MPYTGVGNERPGKKRKAQSNEGGQKKTKRGNMYSGQSQQNIANMLANVTKKRNNASSKESQESFSMKRCVTWFHEYADSKNQIEPVGMERFCKSLGVQPDNIVMLILAHHLHAKTMGYFTLEEWCQGMRELRCDSTSKLKRKLPTLSTQLEDLNKFKAIYRYAFDFAKDTGQRTIDLETAKIMLNLLLQGRWSLLDQFCSFLDKCHNKCVNRDQWNNVLEFSRNIKSDLSNYDMDGAWPVMMDEFVDMVKSNMES